MLCRVHLILIACAVSSLCILMAPFTSTESDVLADATGASGEPIWIYDSDLQVAHVETADLNGDDFPDVIAGEYNTTYYGYPSQVFALDGKTGDTLWTYQLQDGVRAMTIGDINNDGIPDAIAGASYEASPTPDGRVVAIDGVTGGEIWAVSTGESTNDVIVADLNGDEYMDVVYASFDDHFYGINGETGTQIWKRLLGSLWVNAVSAGDVNGDDIDDIAYAHEYLANFDNFCGVVDGTNGQYIWADTVPYIPLKVEMVDIDGDSDLEAVFGVVYGDDHAEIIVRNGLSGEIEWSYDLGSMNHTNGDIVFGLFDVDDDMDTDLVVGRYLGIKTILAFDGTGPTVMMESDTIQVNPRDFAYGDVTGDGADNLAIAGTDRVEVLKGIGALEWYYAVNGTMYGVALGDFDENGILDVAAGGGADNVGSTPPNPQKSVWALKTVLSPVLWEFDFGEYGNEVAVGDVNGDMCDDVAAVASLGTRLWVIDGTDGSELWHWDGVDNLFAVTIGDFDGNGVGDVAVGGYDDQVSAFVGATGASLWTFTDPTDDIYRKCLKSADIDQDGNVDVIAGSEDNFVYAIDGPTGGELWSFDCGADVNDLVLYDMNADDTLDVVAAIGGGTSGEKVVIIDGTDGSEIDSYSCPESVEHVEVMYDMSASRLDPVAGLAPFTEQVIRFNSFTNLQEWSHPMELASNTHGLSVGDVNDDGIEDVAAPGNSTSKSVHMLDGSTGMEIWTYPTGSEVNCVLVEDVDLDGDLEVVAGSDDQNVYVLDGATGDEEFSYSTADDVMHVTTGDLDCNGYPNIVAVTFGSDGVVYAFRTLVQEPQYVCGDADGSGTTDIDDVTYLIAYIFAGGPAPDPLEAGDADCSGFSDIDDVVYIIQWIFNFGPDPCDPDDDGIPDC